jgi:hypothetical protein
MNVYITYTHHVILYDTNEMTIYTNDQNDLFTYNTLGITELNDIITSLFGKHMDILGLQSTNINFDDTIFIQNQGILAILSIYWFKCLDFIINFNFPFLIIHIVEYNNIKYCRINNNLENILRSHSRIICRGC